MYDLSSLLQLKKGGYVSFFHEDKWEGSFGFIVACASDAPMPLQSQNREP